MEWRLSFTKGEKRKKEVKDRLSGSALIVFTNLEVPFESIGPLYDPLMKEDSSPPLPPKAPAYSRARCSMATWGFRASSLPKIVRIMQWHWCCCFYDRVPYLLSPARLLTHNRLQWIFV